MEGTNLNIYSETIVISENSQYYANIEQIFLNSSVYFKIASYSVFQQGS